MPERATLTVAEVARHVDGQILGASAMAGRPARGGYSSDLLSDVIANAGDGDVWITMQRHINVIAVAHLKNLAAIVVVNNRMPDTETVDRAASQGVVFVVTPRPAFDVAGILHGLGLRGGRTS